MRIAFTAGAAISVGLMVGYLAASALTGPSNAIEAVSGDEVVTMLNPRFTGRNIAGEAFVITADTAQRRRSNEKLIDLVNPHLVDETGTEVTAPTGLFDQDAEYLDLFEDVRFNNGDGYAFRTTAARVHVRDGRVTGLEPLSGSGPLGDVNSDTYEISDDGDRIILRGNVSMLIFPGGRDDPARDDEAQEE